MTEIRRATPEDLAASLPCGTAFLHEAALAYGIPLDGATPTAMSAALLSHPEASVFVAEREGKILGCLVGSVLPIWFAPHVRVAHESAWYILPEARGGSTALRLLRAFEAWGRSLGLRYAVASSLDRLDGDAVTHFLARQGYQPTERAHLKEL